MDPELRSHFARSFPELLHHFRISLKQFRTCSYGAFAHVGCRLSVLMCLARDPTSGFSGSLAGILFFTGVGISHSALLGVYWFGFVVRKQLVRSRSCTLGLRFSGPKSSGVKVAVARVPDAAARLGNAIFYISGEQYTRRVIWIDEG